METKSQQYERLRLEYLWVFQWMCRLAFLFTIVCLIDFFLPSTRTTEKITDSWRSGMSRGIRGPLRIVTETGRKFFVPDNQLKAFGEVNLDGHLDLDTSAIFRIVLRAGKNGKMVGISIHYTGFIFIPVLLFLSSIIGVIARNNIEAVYNLGSLSLILTVITLFLLFI